MKATLLQLLTIALLSLTGIHLQAQTFAGQGNLPVPPGAPAETQGITTSDATVSGVGVLGGCNVIDNVTINFEHTWVGDVALFLISPSGTVLELSSGNGGSGNNFQVTSFSDAASLNIVDGAPPYNGGFKPEGRQQSTNCFCSNANPVETWTFANTFNGENADGNWQLYINDYVSLDVGVLISWSITFSSGGTPPVANPASLEACDEGGGQATFDLTSVESVVNGGTGDPVEWYTDMAATISIPNPASYVSGSGTVYAVVVSGGCSSAPVPVTLTVSPAPAANALQVDVCDNCAGWAEVDLTSYDDQVNGGSGNPVTWWTSSQANFEVPNPESVQIFGASYWATVSSGTCESEVVEIDFTLIIPNCGSFTTLSACDDGSGTAVFDLTSVNNIVNNGTSDPVTWFEDQAATIPIANPTSYPSSGGLVFAVVDDGICPSPAVAVSLVVEAGFTPGNVNILATPLTQCGPGNISITFNFISGTNFEVTFNLVNSQGSLPFVETVSNGGTLNFFITETTTFELTDVLEIASGCTANFSPPLSETFAIEPSPVAFPASLEECTTGGGLATFDLTSVNDVVNGGTGEPVNWFTDPGATTPIPNPTAYQSTGGTVYATVGSGACTSAPVEITLTVVPGVSAAPYPIDGCDDGNGTGSFDLTTIENFVNFASGNPVSWFTDPAGTIPITNPSNYVSGEGTIYAVVSNGNCETDPTPIELNLVPTPTTANSFITANPTALCGPGVVSITFSMPEPGVEFTVQMDYGNPSSGFQSYIGVNVFDGSTVPFVISETTQFTLNSVEIENNNGFCSETFANPITVTVTVNDPPELTPIGSPSICAGANFDLSTAVSTSSGLPITFHTATPPSSANELPSPIVSPSNTTTYFAFVDGGSGCTAEAIITVTVEQPGVPNLATASVCESETNFDLTALQDPVFPSGNWSGPGVTGSSFNATGLTGSVTLTFTPSGNCADPATTTVDVTAVSTPVLGTDDVCESETNFDLGQLADPAFPGGTWSGPGVNGNFFSASGQTGSVTLTYTPTQTCALPATTTVNIVASITPNLGTAQLCETAPPFPLSSLEDPAFPVGTWSGPGVSGAIFSPAGQTGTVTLTFDPDDACAETTATTITISAQPDLILIADPEICEGEAFDLSTAVSTSSGLPISFHSATPPTPANLLPSPIVAPPLGATLFYAFVDGGGDCTATLSVPVEVTESAQPQLLPGSVCESEITFDLVTLQDPAFPNGTWSGPGVAGNIFQPAGQTGTVTLTFTPDGDCGLPATTTIEIEPETLPALGTATLCQDDPPFDLTQIQDPAVPNGTWSGPGVSGSVFSPVGQNGGVTLTFEPTGDCAGLVTTTLTVDAPASPNLSTVGVCASETNFDLTALQDPSFPTGTWSGPGVSGTTFAATGLNGTVILTFAPDGDCVAEATTTVEVELLTAPNLGTASVCASGNSLDLSTLEDPAFTSGTWSGPGVSGASFSPSGQTGTVTLTFAPDANCAEPATTTVTVNETPAVVDLVSDCNSLNEEYTVSFSITGGDPTSYTVNGLPSGASFTSDPFPSGATYSFEVDDANGCGPATVSGSLNCDCATFAGTMDLTGSPFQVCADDVFTATANSDEVLDLNDVLNFVLHDAPGPNLGNVLAVSDLPEFGLPPGGELGTTYYVSAVAANDDGTGTFDPADGCLSVAAGVPVVFYEVETTVGPGGSVCPGDCFDIPLTFGGVAPFEFSYQILTPDSTSNEQLAAPSDNATLTICPADWGVAAGQISVLPVGASDANGCTIPLSGLPPVVVEVLPQAQSALNHTLCPGETLTVGGEIFSAGNPSGTVVLTSGAANGCDSVVVVDLAFFTTDTTLLDPTLCAGSTLTVNGTVYSQLNPSGVEVLTSSAGCDSVVQVALSFDSQVTFELVETLCPGESLNVNGNVYDEANPTGSELFPNGSTSGCDSVVNVNLSFHPAAVGQLAQNLCTGGSLTVNGTVYDEANPAGTEILANASVNGCDSLVEIALTFGDVVTFELTDTICPEGSIIVNGTVYNGDNPTGTELFPGGSSSGCDSVVNVSLNFFPTPIGVFSQVLCEGESVTVNGTVYDQSNPAGFETLFGAGANGCDSVIIVNLFFLENPVVELNPTLCPGESIVVNGTIYDEANPVGSELFTNVGPLGCDSTVIVSLDFYQPAAGLLEQTLCTGGSLTVNGTVYDEANPTGTEILANASVNGCDSILNISLTFNDVVTENLAAELCTGESLEINGTVYDEANPTGTEVFPNGSVQGCDSVLNISLTFLPNVEVELAQTLNAGGSIVVNGTLFDEANPSGVEVIENGAANGCDSTVIVLLTFENEEIVATVTVVPPTCFGDADGQIVVENLSGGNGDYFLGLNAQPAFPVGGLPFVLSDLPPGNYELLISDGTGLFTVQEVVVPSPPAVLLDLGDDWEIELGEDVPLSASTNVLPVTINWEPTTYLDCTDCLDPVVEQPAEGLRYTLTIADENGCTASDEVEILLRKPRRIYVPNAFSPNGDGFNDGVTLFTGDEVTNIRSFRIFDRWGAAVFENFNFPPNDPSLGWDGTHKGELMNPAVFVYFAEVEFIDGEVVLIEGEVNLVR